MSCHSFTNGTFQSSITNDDDIVQQVIVFIPAIVTKDATLIEVATPYSQSSLQTRHRVAIHIQFLCEKDEIANFSKNAFDCSKTKNFSWSSYHNAQEATIVDMTLFDKWWIPRKTNTIQQKGRLPSTLPDNKVYIPLYDSRDSDFDLLDLANNKEIKNTGSGGTILKKGDIILMGCNFNMPNNGCSFTPRWISLFERTDSASPSKFVDSW